MSQMSGRPPHPPVDDTDIKVRNRRMLLVAVVMGTLAFVVAAGYWYTHQPGKAPAPPTALSIRTVDGALVVGSATARHHVLIKESFDCGRCATFERNVQAFLRADAAAGLVQVRYQIPVGSNASYDTALAHDASHALAIHDQAFTQGSVPSSAGMLQVVLDGKALGQADPTDLANALESVLAQ